MSIYPLSSLPKDPCASFVENVETLVKTHGQYLSISYENHVFPIYIYQTKVNAVISQPYYVIQWDQPTLYDGSYYPFKIECVDYFADQNEMNPNHCYIKHIRKTESISGKHMIEFVLAFITHLGAQKAYLNDIATIGAFKTSLSFYTLLAYGKTYYQPFGFQIIPVDGYARVRFGTQEQMRAAMQEIVYQIRGITMQYAYEQLCKAKDAFQLEQYTLSIFDPYHECAEVSQVKHEDMSMMLQLHINILLRYVSKHKDRFMFLTDMLVHYVKKRKLGTYISLKGLLFEQPIYQLTYMDDQQMKHIVPINYSHWGLLLEMYMKQGRWLCTLSNNVDTVSE